MSFSPISRFGAAVPYQATPRSMNHPIKPQTQPSQQPAVHFEGLLKKGIIGVGFVGGVGIGLAQLGVLDQFTSSANDTSATGISAAPTAPLAPPLTTTAPVAAPPSEDASAEPTTPPPVLESPNPNIAVKVGETFVSKGTGFYPDSETATERQGKPLYTLEDFRENGAPHVSVSADTNLFPYNTELEIEEFPGVKFLVDTENPLLHYRGRSVVDICSSNPYSATINQPLNVTVKAIP